MKKSIGILALLFLFAAISTAQAATPEDYLILLDISSFCLETASPQTRPGGDPVAGAYLAYTARYTDEQDGETDVEIREHESTKWLLHDLEGNIRHTALAGELGRLSQGAGLKEIDGLSVFHLGEGYYWWPHENLTVQVACWTAEPAEILRAYLAKWPPTLPAGFALSDEAWLKDEMTRLLECADGWFAQYASGSADLPLTLTWVKNQLEQFLRYRTLYFGLEADAGLMALSEALRDRDETALRLQLSEYRQWWEANRARAIVLN